jgi:hypothetical protein
LSASGWSLSCLDLRCRLTFFGSVIDVRRAHLGYAPHPESRRLVCPAVVGWKRGRSPPRFPCYASGSATSRLTEAGSTSGKGPRHPSGRQPLRLTWEPASTSALSIEITRAPPRPHATSRTGRSCKMAHRIFSSTRPRTRPDGYGTVRETAQESDRNPL